ncbi:MAG TPA: hypothetical protein VJB57_00200 [Dehalococcoidia bacterium]|nr:hypothetical protein [Dehalococcoidia bacterium]
MIYSDCGCEWLPGYMLPPDLLPERPSFTTPDRFWDCLACGESWVEYLPQMAALDAAFEAHRAPGPRLQPRRESR